MFAVHAGYAVLGVTAPIRPALRARFIAPTPAGTQSGNSWANAAPFSALNAQISLAGEKGEVWIRADQGSYTLPAESMILNKGGATVRGVDGAGNAMKAVLVGNRAPNWTLGQQVGREQIWLNSGCDNLTFRDLKFQDAGTCFRLRQSNNNLTFEDIEGVNIRRLIQNLASTGSANITNSQVRRCTARGFSKQMLYFRYDSANILIEDCFGDSERQQGDAWAQGIAIDGTAHDIIMRRCRMINCGEERGEGYWNGDGFVGERGNYNIYLEDCIAENCYDGGFDYKSQITLVRCIALKNKRNFRMWGVALLIDCIGRDPTNYGGSGSSGNAYAYRHGRVLYQNCTFTQQTSLSTIFTPFEAGFMAPDQATLNKVVKPSGAKLYDSENTNDGQYVVWDHNDTTPPTITSMTLRRVYASDPVPTPTSPPFNFQMKENQARVLEIVSNEFGTLEIGGPDAKLVSKYGRTINIQRQDYEAPATADGSQVLKFTVRTVDANGNKSQAYPVNIEVLDQSDAPIGPVEVFAPSGSDGMWLISSPSNFFADTAMTVPSAVGEDVAAWRDTSGKGNHLIFNNPDARPVWRVDEAGYNCLEFDGVSTVGQLGPVGGFRFPFFTSFATLTRARDGGTNQLVYFFGRRALSTDNGANSSNHMYSFAMRDSSSIRFGLTSGGFLTSNGTGGPLNSPVVLSHRSENAEARSNGAVVIDGADNTGNSYPRTNEQPLVGARWDGANYVGFFKGRIYALVIINRTVDDDVRFRIERQLTETNGAPI